MKITFPVYAISKRLASLAALIFLFGGTAVAQTVEDSAAHAQADTVAFAATLPVTDTFPHTADTAKPHYYRINAEFLKTIPYDLKHVVTAPARWDGRDWGRFALVGGGAGLAMLTLDKPVREIIQRNKNGTFDKASDVFYPLGNRFPPLLLSGMYLTGVLTKNRRLEHASLSIAKSLAVATLVYTASKSLVRRQRPTRTDNPYDFVAPFSHKGYTSFPSGHSNTAFAVATAFALEYRDVKWVPWLAYSLATLTAVSRMYDDRHWFSDVIIGASVGHFITRAVYKLEQKRKDARTTNLKGLL